MVRIYPEHGSETFVQWEPVELDSSNSKVTRMNTTAGGGLTGDTTFLGWALCAASGTENTSIPVLIADDLTEWCLPVVHATAATAVTAITNPGKSYTISHLATSGWYGYEISVTTNPVFEVSELSAEYAAGEQYGWAWGKIVIAARQIV